jgi:hypothetical protein
MAIAQQIHVRINDAATGQPTPCRVRFSDARGKYFAPYGRLTDFATGQGIDVGGNLLLNLRAPSTRELTLGGSPTRFAYTDGRFEIALPVGPIHVTISKGPEFVPIDEEIQLVAGKLALRFVLKRWSDVRQHGWYPGDVRAHYLTPHAAVLDGAGEDLSVVNVLARITWVDDDSEETIGAMKSRSAIPNLLEFSGQEPALERHGCLVAVNTHNNHAFLGSLGLLNCHRVVYPLTFGGYPFVDAYEDWTLADWCDQCHRKDGLVVWTRTHLGHDGKVYGEGLADLLLGKVDAVEVMHFGQGDEKHPWPFIWYDMLNCGLRVPLVGASAKDSNTVPLGRVRTYAQLQPDQTLSYGNWIEAVRRGKTMVTNGPMLQLFVEDQGPGATVRFAEDRPVQVRADTASLVPFEHLELIVNGHVVAEQSPSGDPATARIEKEIDIPDGGWVTARCWGKSWVPGQFDGQRVYAHTSPVYVRVKDRQPPVDAGAIFEFHMYLDKMLYWVNHQARFENDAQRRRLAHIFEQAGEVLENKLSPPPI